MKARLVTWRPSGIGLYTSSLFVATGLLALIPPGNAWFARSPLELALLCGLGIVAETIPRSEVLESTGLSFLSIVITAAVALVGSVGAALVGVAAFLCALRSEPLPVRLFNAGMTGLLGAVSGVVYLAAGGQFPEDVNRGPWSLIAHVGAPMVAANLVYVVVNALLMSGVIRLTSPVPIRENLWRLLNSSGPAILGHGVLAFLLVVLLRRGSVGPLAALLILAPLLGAQWAYSQLADQRRTRGGAIDALATTAEVSGGSNRGQGERVAAIAALIARSESLSHQQVDTLMSAARLHDLGMIGEPFALLSRPAPFDDAAVSALTAHPARSVRMIRQIEFLSNTFAVIRHHHERIDGCGYPDGLVADAIPVLSRVLAVADAFDALTIASRGRTPLTPPEALAELQRRAGAQLDGRFVDALRRGFEDEQELRLAAERASKAEASTEVNHDDPEVSDVVAKRVGHPILRHGAAVRQTSGA